MYSKLSFIVRYQDRETIFRLIPPIVQKKYPRLTAIVDCFEIFIESPRDLHAKARTYSQYKSHTTAKVFISCGPLGHINYVLKAWGGRVSDVQIVRDSNYISFNYHLPNDQILADRGFRLKEDFAAICSAELIIPAFTRGLNQMPAEDVENSRSMSSIPIHIERVIGLLRNRYTILKGTLPLRTVKSMKDEHRNERIASIDKIVMVCSALTNFGEGIVFVNE